MKIFWLSWLHREAFGGFELSLPWWVTGFCADSSYETICAAVRAESGEAAKELIRQSYDTPPDTIEWRFCEERSADWSPFNNDRFERADWMQW